MRATGQERSLRISVACVRDQHEVFRQGLVFEFRWNLIQPIVQGMQTIAGGVGAVSNAVSGGAQSALSGGGSILSTLGSDLSSLIPHFASGGIVNSPTIAMVGESGPESIIPMGSSGPGQGGPVFNTTVNVHGSVTSEGELIQKIDRALWQQYSRLRRS
jgi:phage-related minor tail protein